jgi:hypothetical protein
MERRPKMTFKDRMLEFIYRIMSRVVPHSDQKRADVPESSLNDPKFHSETENYLEENLFRYMYQTYADPVLETFVYEPGKRLRRTVRSIRRKSSKKKPKKIKKEKKDKIGSNVPDNKEPLVEEERLDQFREHATFKLQEWIAYHQSILDELPGKELPSYMEW